jgi:hypothetical protein
MLVSTRRLFYSLSLNDPGRIVGSKALGVGGSTAGILIVFGVVPRATLISVLKVGSIPAHSYALRVGLFLVRPDIGRSSLASLSTTNLGNPERRPPQRKRSRRNLKAQADCTSFQIRINASVKQKKRGASTQSFELWLKSVPARRMTYS